MKAQLLNKIIYSIFCTLLLISCIDNKSKNNYTGNLYNDDTINSDLKANSINSDFKYTSLVGVWHLRLSYLGEVHNNKIIKDSTLTLKIIDTLIEIKSNSLFIADTLKLNKNSNQYIEFVFRNKKMQFIRFYKNEKIIKYYRSGYDGRIDIFEK